MDRESFVCGCSIFAVKGWPAGVLHCSGHRHLRSGRKTVRRMADEIRYASAIDSAPHLA
jgi:hypothetical protein